MAVIKNFNDEDQQNQPTSGSSQSAFVQSQAGSSPFSQQKSGSQNFQNLQKFMQANKNIDMQSGIVKNMQERSKMLGKSLGESKEKFIQQLTPEKQRLEQAEQTTQQALGQYQDIGAGQLHEGISNLAQPLKQQVEDVRKLRRGDFKSNFEIQDLPKQQIATERFKNLTGGALTEKGRFDILNKAFGGLPGYTSNLARVDQLLLQGAGADRIKQMDTSLKGLGAENVQKLEDLKRSREEQNAALRALGLQAQEKVVGMLSGERSGLETELQNRALQYKSDIENRQKALQEKFKTGQALTASDAEVLKLNPDEEFVKFYNANRLQTVAPDRKEILARQGQGVEADISGRLQALGTEGITNKSVASQQNLLKSIALSRLAEDESLLQKVGQYGEGYNMADFLALQSPEAIADIEKAFTLGGTEVGDWTSMAARQALQSGQYNKAIQASQQLASEGDFRVARGGRSMQQAMQDLSGEMSIAKKAQEYIEAKNLQNTNNPYNEITFMGKNMRIKDLLDLGSQSNINRIQGQYSLLEKGTHGANIDEIISTVRSDALRKMIETGQLKDIGQLSD